MAYKYLLQPHISISYIMLDSTRDSINSLQIPIVMCLSSVWHHWRQAPNTHVPAPALFPAISVSSRYPYSLNTYILWRHHLDYLTIHLICHLTLLWSDVFLRISIIPLLAMLIFTPHSLHHLTRMPKLFLLPDASDATKQSSANSRAGTMPFPLSTPHFSSYIIL